MTHHPIIPSDPSDEALARRQQFGAAADQYARAGVFADYRARKADHTVRRQRADLATLAEYLTDGGIEASAEALQHDPAAWHGMTWGVVAGFVQWLLQAGYAVGTVNIKLSTVKTYAQLAFKAGVIGAEQQQLIRTVEGYQHKEVSRVDKRRADAGSGTRRGAKKAAGIVLSRSQIRALKDQPDTPQGRRDALLLHIGLDLGLRCGEIALLTVGSLDLENATLRVERPKVGKVGDQAQTHRLRGGLLHAVRAYMEHDAPLLKDVPLLRKSAGSGRTNDLGAPGMSERAITKRVAFLGRQIGVEGLSAHDLRHTWATWAARSGTPLDRLMDAGGWNAYAMPLRYIEAAQIANEGVITADD